MSKINTVRSDLTLDDIDELVNGCDVADDDYILVIGHDGELKSVFMPDVDASEVPESVQQTLAQYGVVDINYVTGNTTLH
jgi:hypothetical protein